MKNATRALMILVGIGSLQILGCNPASFVSIPPVEINLSDNNVADFDVTAGSPTTRAIGGLGAVDTLGFDLRGSLEIDPNAITVNPTDPSGGKMAVVQQVVDDCLTACNGAQIDAAVCDDVCSNGTLQITVWVAESGDSSVCDAGDNTDQYGPYVVTLDLDDNARVVSVSPASVSLTSRTQDWLGTTGATFCVQVLAPISGTVVIDSLIVNLSL